MKITRIMKISFITERKIIAASPNGANEIVVCRQCAAGMIPARISTDFFHISSREICCLIEADKIHFVETEDHKIFICPVSFKENRDFENAAESL